MCQSPTGDAGWPWSLEKCGARQSLQEVKLLPTSHRAESVFGPSSVLAPRSALGLFGVFSRRLEVVVLPNKQKPVLSSRCGYLCSACKCLEPSGSLVRRQRELEAAGSHTSSGSVPVTVVHCNSVLPSKFYE